MSVVIWVADALAALKRWGNVFSPQLLYSALPLVMTIGALAVVFLVLNAQFLFVVQPIVHAGAVMVLFVHHHRAAVAWRRRACAPRQPLAGSERWWLSASTAAMVVAARNGSPSTATTCFALSRSGRLGPVSRFL